jgi:hypothetical protein
MASNLGGVPSGQIFRADDAPFYERGMKVLTALAAFCWVLVSTLGLWYRHDQKKSRQARSW